MPSIVCGLKSWLNVFEDPFNSLNLAYFALISARAFQHCIKLWLATIFGYCDKRHKFQNFYRREIFFYMCDISHSLHEIARLFFMDGENFFLILRHIFSRLNIQRVLSCRWVTSKEINKILTKFFRRNHHLWFNEWIYEKSLRNL